MVSGLTLNHGESSQNTTKTLTSRSSKLVIATKKEKWKRKTSLRERNIIKLSIWDLFNWSKELRSLILVLFVSLKLLLMPKKPLLQLNAHKKWVRKLLCRKLKTKSLERSKLPLMKSKEKIKKHVSSWRLKAVSWLLNAKLLLDSAKKRLLALELTINGGLMEVANVISEKPFTYRCLSNVFNACLFWKTSRRWKPVSLRLLLK